MGEGVMWPGAERVEPFDRFDKLTADKLRTGSRKQTVEQTGAGSHPLSRYVRERVGVRVISNDENRLKYQITLTLSHEYVGEGTGKNPRPITHTP